MVRFDGPKIVVDVGLHRDTRPDRAPKQLRRFGNARFEIDRFQRDRRSTGKAKELAGQFRSALGGFFTIAEQFLDGSSTEESIIRQRQIAEDNRQQIVEIVCHSAREPADCLHFAGLTNLFFQTPPARDVAPDPQVNPITSHCRRSGD